MASFSLFPLFQSSFSLGEFFFGVGAVARRGYALSFGPIFKPVLNWAEKSFGTVPTGSGAS